MKKKQGMSQDSFIQKKIKFQYLNPPVKKQGSMNLIFFLNNFMFYLGDRNLKLMLRQRAETFPAFKQYLYQVFNIILWGYLKFIALCDSAVL